VLVAGPSTLLKKLPYKNVEKKGEVLQNMFGKAHLVLTAGTDEVVVMKQCMQRD
jgi:hypothetical protein